MNGNGQLSMQAQMDSAGPLSLLSTTSRLLTEAESVDQHIMARAHSKAVANLFQDMKVQQQLRLEAACMMIRAEHALGCLLAQIPLAQGAPGNQRTGKVDRSHSGTGPLFLKDLGLSKNASQRAQVIATIPKAELERWLAEQCQQGKEPSLRGALKYAKKLQETGQQNSVGKPSRPDRSATPPESLATPSSEELRRLLEEAQQHVSIISRQLEPLYEHPPRPLKEIELHTIKRYLQEVVDTIGQLRDCQPTLPSSRPDVPFGGGKIFAGGFFCGLPWSNPIMDRSLFTIACTSGPCPGQPHRAKDAHRSTLPAAPAAPRGPACGRGTAGHPHDSVGLQRVCPQPDPQ